MAFTSLHLQSWYLYLYLYLYLCSLLHFLPFDAGICICPGEDPSITAYLVRCTRPLGFRANPEQCYQEYCLFNITADPCEYVDLAASMPELVGEMRQYLGAFGDIAAERG
jgi:hypothetical protein